jgi:hypothetical protein
VIRPLLLSSLPSSKEDSAPFYLSPPLSWLCKYPHLIFSSVLLLLAVLADSNVSTMRPPAISVPTATGTNTTTDIIHASIILLSVSLRMVILWPGRKQRQHLEPVKKSPTLCLALNMCHLTLIKVLGPQSPTLLLALNMCCLSLVKVLGPQSPTSLLALNMCRLSLVKVPGRQSPMSLLALNMCRLSLVKVLGPPTAVKKTPTSHVHSPQRTTSKSTPSATMTTKSPMMSLKQRAT